LLDVVKMRLAQIGDLARYNGWSFVLKELAFVNRTAVVVEKDLSEIADRAEPLASANLQVVEIDQKLLAAPYRFSSNSRRLKAIHNLKGGYGGMALVRDNVIIGDTWYWIPESTDPNATLHIDLRRFGIKNWSERYVYTFDIFVAHAERKSGVSAAFQNRAMLLLRSKGYTKAFGFYWADNIPAHWCTRVTNKWKKLRDVRVTRFLTFMRAVPVPESQALPPNVTTEVKERPDKETTAESEHARTADESAEHVHLGV